LLKKRLYITLSACICIFSVKQSAGQTITLPQANISANSDYTVTSLIGPVISLAILPTFRVRSPTSNFTADITGETIPVSVARPKLRSAGAISLLGSSSEVTLSTTNANLYVALASIGAGGTTLIDYRVITAGTVWKAGTYRSNLQYSIVGIGNSVSPPALDLVIDVPAFISADVPPVSPATITMDAIAKFRNNNGNNVTSPFTYSTTVINQIALKTTTGGSAFTYTGTAAVPPVTAVNLVAVSSDITSPATFNLSGTNQLLNTSNLAVPATNKSTITPTFTISRADLQTAFIQAGTYTIPLTYTISKPAAAYPTASTISTTTTVDLKVITSDLAELVVAPSQPNITFNYNSAASYTQSNIVTLSGHLTLSKTTPYIVTVRANAANLTLGVTTNQIPVNMIIIEPMAGQTGVNTITLSNAPQTLISASNPVIDRQINLQYRIPSSQNSNLVGKPSGTYETTVTYTLVAP